MIAHFILLALGLCFAPAPARSQESSKPDVLVIMAGDVGVGDMPSDFWGQTSKVTMTNIQALIDNGVRFKDAHATPASPSSRYAFLSGNYAHRGLSFAGIGSPNYVGGQFRDGQVSIAQTFKSAGYETFMAGKYHIGAKIPQTDRSTIPDNNIADTILSDENHNWALNMSGGPQSIGFEYSFISLEGNRGAPYAWMEGGLFPPNIKAEAKLYEDEGIVPKKGQGEPNWNPNEYNEKLLDRFDAFVGRNGRRRNDDGARVPFFAYVSLKGVTKPHVPFSDSYSTDHMDLLSDTDQAVGRLINALSNESNTVIVFVGDNGAPYVADSVDAEQYSNGPFRGHRGSIYEGGHRVPLIIRFDQLRLGKQIRNLPISITDLYRTIANLAEVTVPDGQAIDSKDYAGYISDKTYFNRGKCGHACKAGRRTYMGIWVFTPEGGLVQEAMRWKDIKLIHNVTDDEWELYNLTKDRYENDDFYTKYWASGSAPDRNSTYTPSDDEPTALRLFKMVKAMNKHGPCRDSTKAFGRINQNMGNESLTCADISSYGGKGKEYGKYVCDDRVEFYYYCGATCATIGDNEALCSNIDDGMQLADYVKKYRFSDDMLGSDRGETLPYEIRVAYSAQEGDNDEVLYDWDDDDDDDDDEATSAAIQTGASQLVLGLAAIFSKIL